MTGTPEPKTTRAHTMLLAMTHHRMRQSMYVSVKIELYVSAFISAKQMSQFFAKKPLEPDVKAAGCPDLPTKGYSLTAHE